MTTEPLLSLCMIVKNEEIYLPNCLESVQNVADEIIVVDTGSTDDTPKIARQFGASVYDYLWQYDFSAARNFGLEKAQGKFILFLDADEELSPEAQKHLRSFLNDTSADGIYLIVRSFSSSNALAPYSDSDQVRLFRNRPEYRFQNLIHEMIYPSIVAHHGQLYRSQFVIHHYGYLKNLVQGTETRIARDRRLLEQMCLKQPDSLYAKAKLGFIYVLEQEYPKAIQLLQEVTHQIDPRSVEPDFLHSIFIALAQSAQAMGNFKLAKECAKAGWSLNAQPSLTRSSMFYYATSSAGMVIERVERLANGLDQSKMRAEVRENLISDKDQIRQSISIIDELSSHPDLSPQAKENLSMWREKMMQVDELVHEVLAIIENDLQPSG